MPEQPNKAVREFLSKLTLIHAEAMQLGLHVTARALHNAVKASGWEAAGDIVKAGLYAPNLERAEEQKGKQ